jgi:hypothetical protein
MCEEQSYPESIQIKANGKKRWKKQEKIKQLAIIRAFDNNNKNLPKEEDILAN